MYTLKAYTEIASESTLCVSMRIPPEPRLPAPDHSSPAKLGADFGIDDLFRRPFAFAQSHDGAGRRQRHVVARLQIHAGAVRRQHHIIQREERMILGRRFLLEYVDPGPGDTFAL